LKIETEILEDHQAKIRVETDPAQLEEAKRRAARAIAKRTKIPGFRPGKAPYHIIERFVGEETIYQDAIELMVKDIYPKALEESKINPYGPGELENIPSQDPLVFEFVAPLEAEVELSDYREIRFPYEQPVVTDEDVDQVLKNIRDQQAVLEPVERPAAEGDQVVVRMRGKRTNPAEGENEEIIREMPVPIVIESETSQDSEEWPYPGFSKELIGLSTGDEKTLLYTYPEDTTLESLRGAEVEFTLKVESVKQRQVPELDDEFAVSQGDYEDLASLRADIRRRMEERNRLEYEEEYSDQALNEVIENSTIKYPPQMVERELEGVMRQLEERLSQQNMDLEMYMKSRQIDQAALEEEMRPVAIKRLERLLTVFEIAKKEDVAVKPEEVQTETLQTIQQIHGSMGEKDFNKQITRDFVEHLSANITADMLIKNTMNRLVAIAKGEGDQVAEEELVAEEQPVGQEDLAEEEVLDESGELVVDTETQAGEEAAVTSEARDEPESVQTEAPEAGLQSGEPETEDPAPEEAGAEVESIEEDAGEDTSAKPASEE
jgi:trigger factor